MRKPVWQRSERSSGRGVKSPCVHAAWTAHDRYVTAGRQNYRLSLCATESKGKWIAQVTGIDLSIKLA